MKRSKFLIVVFSLVCFIHSTTYSSINNFCLEKKEHQNQVHKISFHDKSCHNQNNNVDKNNKKLCLDCKCYLKNVLTHKNYISSMNNFSNSFEIFLISNHYSLISELKDPPPKHTSR